MADSSVTHSEHRVTTVVDHGVEVDYCIFDGEDWPCDAVRRPAQTAPEVTP